MRVRFASALVLASQLVLIAMLLRLDGRTAIAFSFLGAPLLGVAVLMVATNWWREREGYDAKSDSDGTRRPSGGGRG